MTHQIVAVIPVRSFRNGKTRLADVLAPERRAALGRHLLAHVVTAARGSGNLGAIAIVSPDPEVLAYAASLGSGIVPVDQDGAAGGLNGALDQGRAWARAGGAGALLILFSDLPRLTAGDVRALTRASSTVAIAPDRHVVGTNALLLRLDSPARANARFAFQFGPGSFARHMREARRLGLSLRTLLAAGTAFDLDTPDDLEVVGAGGWEMSERAAVVPNAGGTS